MNVSSRRKRVESRAKPNDGTRDVWQVPLSETRLLLSVASRRARGFQGEIAGGPYQGHACRVPHHVVRGHRARNFCRSSPTLRKPSQISPSPLSLCFSFPPPITLPLFPLHTSLPRPPGVQHRDTLSHSRYPRSPRSPYRSHSLLLSPLFSFIRREPRPPRTPVVRPSQLVRLRSRPASVSLRGPTSRECTNRKVEVHTCVCGNERSVGMREEKRPRSYGSAPATRLFPSLHHLLSSPRILLSSARPPIPRAENTGEGGKRR